MFPSFELNATLGRSYNANPDDTLRTKRALHDLGYYTPPRSTNNDNGIGFTPYPDTGLFDGIESFQSDYGLKKDGVMKPNGETAVTLGTVMAQNTDNSKKCRHGYHPETKRTCIPFTKICWSDTKCVPNPIGGRRG